MSEEKKAFGEESEPRDRNAIGLILRNLRQKRSWQVGALVLVLALLALFHLLGGKDKAKEKKPGTWEDEKREIYKPQDFKKAIERQEASSQRKVERPKSQTKNAAPKNYDSEIAVFVFEKKEKGKGRQWKGRDKKEPLGLTPGTKVAAYISGTIFSFNTASPVTAIVTKDIQKDGKIVIPKDSRFLGEAGVLKSLNRINVAFDLLTFPDGREIRVRALALSEDGSSGIKGKVTKHRDRKALKAIGETLLAGASLFSGGVRSAEPFSLEDQLRLNLAQNLTQEARRELQSVKVETAITVDSYTPIQVILLDGI